MRPYALFLHAEVLAQLARMRRRERVELWSFFTRLGDDPFWEPDFAEHTVSGPCGVTIVGKHAIVYHADHAAREIKIVSLRDADRR